MIHRYVRRKRLLITLITGIFLSSVQVSAQGSRGWESFEGVKFESQYDERIDDYQLLPEFSDEILAKEGTVIELTGYYVPFDLEDGAVILSRYPYAQCFFCGNAGPESVAEVYFKQQQGKFLPDQLLSVSGILKLNTNDSDHLNFILEEAELIDN